MAVALRRTLPPTNSLVVFEAAARHMNFTRAAEELSVTQSAVSRQVQLLAGPAENPIPSSVQGCDVAVRIAGADEVALEVESQFGVPIGVHGALGANVHLGARAGILSDPASLWPSRPAVNRRG